VVEDSNQGTGGNNSLFDCLDLFRGKQPYSGIGFAKIWEQTSYKNSHRYGKSRGLAETLMSKSFNTENIAYL